MKNLKLLLGLAAIVVASSLSSCEKDEISKSSSLNQTENAITSDSTLIKLKLVDLPAPIKTKLESEFPGFIFVEAKKTTSTAGVNIYGVKILLKLVINEIKFDANGKILSISKSGIPASILKEADLLTEIKTYLTTTYPGYKFVSAEKYVKETKTFFEVKIKNAAGAIVELKFDSVGKILIMSTVGAIETSIAAGDLLPAITTYLKEKYTTYTLVSAKKVTKNGVTAFELKIKVGTATFELKFNPNGVIIASSDNSLKNTPLTLATLPAAINEYLKANYAGFSFVSAEKSENAQAKVFNVKIKQNNITFEIKFDANGAFLKVSGSNKSSETKITLIDLPTTAQTYLKTTFPDLVLISARKIVKTEVISYYVKLKSNKKTWDIVFDSTGKMISKKS